MRCATPIDRCRILNLGLIALAIAAGGIAPGFAGADDPAAYETLLREIAQRQRSRDWPAAAELLAKAVQLNPTQARHWWELGLARAGAGQFRPAIEAFRRADELGNGFTWDPVFFIARGEAQFQIACCHAQLGEPDQAIAAAAQAVAVGLRRPRRLLSEGRLAALHDDPRLCDLAGAIDTGALARDDAYRAELKFLAREMFRLHYNPYHVTPRQRFDAEIAALDAEIPHLSDDQIAMRFQRLLCLLGDGHTGLRLKSARVVPLEFFWFDEGIFIVGVRAGHERLLGAQVLKLGERAIDEVIKAFDPVVARDNEMTVRSFTPGMLRVLQCHAGLDLQSDTTALQLTVTLRDGSSEQIRMLAETRRDRDDDDRSDWITVPPGEGPLPLSWSHPDKMLWFEPTRQDRVVYAAIDGLGNARGESFANFCTRLLQYVEEHPEVERLILDFRRNGGGNTFLNRPLIHGLVRSRINHPGGLVVLIGRRTFSAAQNTVTEIERHTQAVFFGEPTGSRPNFIGETVRFPLPYSGNGVSISDLYWGTSSPLDRRMWLEPHFYVPPRAADYLARHDRALEDAIHWQPAGSTAPPPAKPGAAR